VKRSERLGFHGIVVVADDPTASARRWRELAAFPVLRRTRSEVVLGAGPELFVALRRPRRGEKPGVVELHLAVKEIARTRRRAAPDALGSDSWARPLREGGRLVVREFKRAPGRLWRKKRPAR
jgi:hypothetical protein